MRKSYDAYLAEPDRSEAYHMYKYYEARYTPKHNPFYVVGTFLSLLSLLQYTIRSNMYKKARKNLKNSNQFRNKVGQVYEKEKMYSDNPRVIASFILF